MSDFNKLDAMKTHTNTMFNLLLLLGLLTSCEQDSCNGDFEPADIILLFTFNDNLTGDDLFFGGSAIYTIDNLTFESENGTDYIAPLENKYFEISGLFPINNTAYTFDIKYDDAFWGTLKVEYENLSKKDCPDMEEIYKGITLTFNETVICKGCSINTTYKLKL